MSGANGAATQGAMEQKAAPADLRMAGTEDLMAEFAAIEKAEGKESSLLPEIPEVSAKPGEEPPKPEAKPKDEKPKGKKTAQDYALERVRAREERIAAREAELMAKVADLDEKLSLADATSPAKLRALVESGKADDLAKTMGYDSWEKLNDHFARLYASPEYKRIRELEEKDRRRDAEIAARAEQERQQAQQREWVASVNAAVDEVSEALKANDDAVLAAFGEDRDFCAEVTRLIIEDGKDPDIEQIASQVLERVRARHEAVSARFNSQGGRPTSRAETANAGTPNRPGSKQVAKPQKHVSRQSATEASNPLPKNMTDDEWLAYGKAEMAKAFRADAEEREREKEA